MLQCAVWLWLKGIREGIEVLKRDSDGTTGGTLIVVSDGQENRRPFIEDVFDEVHTIFNLAIPL